MKTRWKSVSIYIDISHVHWHLSPSKAPASGCLHSFSTTTTTTTSPAHLIRRTLLIYNILRNACPLKPVEASSRGGELQPLSYASRKPVAKFIERLIVRLM